jgi:hypothetical protein
MYNHIRAFQSPFIINKITWFTDHWNVSDHWNFVYSWSTMRGKDTQWVAPKSLQYEGNLLVSVSSEQVFWCNLYKTATWYMQTAYIINLLKTKRICFIYGLSAYCAVNTLHFGYKNQSLNVL